MCLIAAADGLLCVGIGRGAVVARRGSDGAWSSTVLESKDAVVCVACSGDGALVVTASSDKVLRCYDGGALAGEAFAPRRPSALALAPLPGGGLACLAACAGELAAFPAPTLDKQSVLLGHTSSVLTGIAVAPSGTLIATCDRNEKVRVSRFPQCAVVESFCLGHETFVSGCAFLSETELVSSGGDGALRLWDPATGACAARVVVGGPATTVSAMAVSGPTVALALEGEATIVVYADKFDARQELALDRPPVDLAFAGGRLVALVRGDDGSAALREFEPRAGGFEAAAAPSPAAAAVAAADVAALGPCTASAFLQAVEERDHDHGFAAKNVTVKPSVLNKHKLDTRFDASNFSDCAQKLTKGPRLQ